VLLKFKDHLKSVLRVSSAHSKWGPTINQLINQYKRPTVINIAQILHLPNFFELKRTIVYIHLQLREPEKC
jgi:hypothetical protein